MKELLGEAGLETEDQFEGVFPLESVEALSTLDQELAGNPGYRQKAVSNIQKTQTTFYTSQSPIYVLSAASDTIGRRRLGTGFRLSVRLYGLPAGFKHNKYFDCTSMNALWFTIQSNTLLGLDKQVLFKN